MSQIYASLPKTKGKVVIVTDCGDIEIELFSKETPKTCRNFVQLCLEQFYNGNIFHRIVADQFIQTGDPTGNGDYGDSIYDCDESGRGKPFDAEYHSRIKFSQRGLIACAAQNGKCDSRFFITLNRLDALNFKHTIFGQVVGDTIFNVTKIAELEVDPKTDRPIYPPKILRTEVIINPFPDIVPRKKIAVQDSGAKKRKKKQNANLLSFSEEADLEELSAPVKTKKSKKETKSENSVDSTPTISHEDDKPTQPIISTTSEQDEEESIISHKEIKPTQPIVSSNKESREGESVSAEDRFSSLRMAREEREQAIEGNETKQSAKKYLNDQLQKYKRKKDKDQREQTALEKFQKFSQALKSTDTSSDWQKHSLVYKKDSKE